MAPSTLLLVILCYVALISLLAWWSNRGRTGSNADFYLASRQAPWYLVAFGMVGASLSGVTFISVPGDVGVPLGEGVKGMGYLQIAMGYLAGYLVIAFVLLPLYYRLQLTSIYAYLGQRFGPHSEKTGTAFFLLSRSLGSAVRLFLAVSVLQALVFDAMGVPFALTALGCVLFVIFYTRRGGIRTVVLTDTLQTGVMMAAVVVSATLILQRLELAQPVQAMLASPWGTVFQWDAARPDFFLKHVLAGATICIVMTGLDQDMMQKNLAVRSLRDAQKNMLVFNGILFITIAVFVGLGVLLYMYAAQTGYAIPARADLFFPTLAVEELGLVAGILVVVGLMAAAFSSADGSLAALTTAISINFLNLEALPEQEALRSRKRVYALVSVGYFVLVLGFEGSRLYLTGQVNVITLVLSMAAYTYGPLLGLYAYGMASRRRVRDAAVPWLALAAPVTTYLLQWGVAEWTSYAFGFELILLNGALMLLGLHSFSHKGESAEA